MADEPDRSLEIVVKQANVGASFVPLNVRGTRIYASRASLLAATGSYFPIMLQDRQAQYFLDVDPTHFHRILGFLQHGGFSFIGLNLWEIHELRSTIAYLHLTIPHLTAWAWLPTLRTDTLISGCGNTKIKLCDAFARGDTAVTSFQVTVSQAINLPEIGKCLIGFAPRKDFELAQSIRPQDLDGFFFNVLNGKVYGPGDNEGRQYKPKSPQPCGYYSGESNFRVAVELRSDNSIHFALHGTALGQAFQLPPPRVPLFPTVYTTVSEGWFHVIA
ncbi:Aste57867_19435 [Aphanomyces stellatus]|uniref:Aste57867_19435 protein n=1 Tax=Aphanomyces stellatus TaxID=120398 RepID=A0A485LDY1_9STRA|nr:hypothetical protein As57867_019371 [Aphanomyces stellatus]VFT96149.1 Aste57867_19435 [Aphanomyces stellatus]